MGQFVAEYVDGSGITSHCLPSAKVELTEMDSPKTLSSLTDRSVNILIKVSAEFMYNLSSPCKYRWLW
jgi:hypothetical protein